MRRLACLLCFLAIGSDVSDVSAQGLDAAARKEKERREKNKQAGVKARVVSDQEVRSGGDAAAPPAAAPEAGAEGQPAVDLSALEAPASSGSSATSDARAKAERWRARYRPAKERVSALEREVAELNDKASRIGAIVQFVGPGASQRNPNVRTESEAVVQRLGQAKSELASAKRALAAIEESARRDGVPSGQIY